MCKSKFSTFAIKADYSRLNRIINARDRENELQFAHTKNISKVGSYLTPTREKKKKIKRLIPEFLVDGTLKG